ncbi:hypothetical protein ISN45_Aa03g001270 [Arabidopsis thaliana x Arabidopsis arenosa]|uniref:Uncharacterized protein n=1 Tax=Arabidopsis thaliana x Arabidopsis arenosa TaxID=1240361 RepID=A0A8T2ANQ9_9BRAS|nr:hypothetical protein ISN45_Aa03g001270 [Arabidopsis thaliana x Arabidopsis arenosa]
METETENKEHQWKNSMSSRSSSRSSSITSASSDGHFDIRHFPLPKPSLSASEAQKLRESHQAYNSSVSSYTSSSWSSNHQNHLVDLPGYDPSRIPSSVFSSKPGNLTEWSLASNESLFSIHDGNFSISTALRLAEIPKFEETVQEITEINTVPLSPPLPPVKKTNESEKETISEEKPYQVENSDSEIDDNEEEEEKMSEVESDDEHEDMIEAEVLVEKEVIETVKENKPEDSNSIVSHSPSISCRSDTSNNSIGSFAFPLLQKEDAVIKTPSMLIKGNVSHKRRPEYQLPQKRMLPPQQQLQPYSESSMLTESESESIQQRKALKKFESRTQSLKASRTCWFSCFHCPSKCGIFK